MIKKREYSEKREEKTCIVSTDNSVVNETENIADIT